MSNKNRELKRLAKKKRRAQRFWLFIGLGGVFLVTAAVLLSLKGRNATSLAAVEVNGAPSLKADQEKIDLGDEKLGNTVEVSFQISNVGDKPLRFSKQPYVEVVEGC